MSFLQPFVLWGLPLILLPIIIHLMNRMRHRPQPWAAMRFLLAATQSSVSNAKLREWLILALRVLAVLMLIFFLARPLAGGWIGWAFSPAPDTILILLDRSASMEAQASGANGSKREEALRLLTQAAKPFADKSHLVLLDSATKTPQDLARAESLQAISATAPSDTAADFPGLMQTAIAWLIENKAGTSEIWIASDLQRSNWSPTDSRWASVASQLAALPQKVRVRVLGVTGSTTTLNRAISLKEALRVANENRSEVRLTLDLLQTPAANEPVPISIAVEGAESSRDVVIENGALRWRQRLAVDPSKTTGWGSLKVPADANPADNTTYFVFGPSVIRKSVVVGEVSPAGRVLRLAAATKDGVLTSDNPEEWRDCSLIVWQKPLPTGTMAEAVLAFVEQGGTVVFFPPLEENTASFDGVAWSAVENAAVDHPFAITKWAEDDGPLAKSDEGFSLPVREVAFLKRRIITGTTASVASFEDGRIFLARKPRGKGEMFFCASLPLNDWSSLADGPVLVPLLQRMITSGSKRLQQVSTLACGELTARDLQQTWNPLTPGAKDPRFQTGVYSAKGRFIAVNRPTAEDEPEVVDAVETRRLFGAVRFDLFLQQNKSSDRFEGEVWRVFLVVMILFLIVEGWLIMPPKPSINAAQTVRRAERELETVP